MAGKLILALLLATTALASPALAQTAGGGAEITLDPIQVQAQGQAEGGSAEGRVEGYVPKTSTVGTKTDTPIIEVPQSVSVISREQMDDRNVQSVAEALTYTPGVRVGAYGDDPRYDSFFIRGFDSIYTGVFRDGLREANGTYSIFKAEPYGLDKLTVLKGPSSGLYGLSSIGGIVELTTKRPPLDPIREVMLQIGTYDRYQAQFDVGGPVDESKEVSGRLTGLFRDSGTSVPGGKDDRVYIAPALTWRPDGATSFTVLGEYLDSTTSGNPFYWRRNGRVTNLPLAHPSYNDFDQRQFRVGYLFEHQLDEIVTVRQNARFAHIDADMKYSLLETVNRATGLATVGVGRGTDDFSTFVIDNQVEAKAVTGPVKHTIVGGVDYSYSHLDEKTGYAANVGVLDIHTWRVAPPGLPGSPYTGATTQERHQVGAYVQDQARLGNWILTLTGRHDWVETETRNRSLAPVGPWAGINQEEGAFSGRAGLTYLTEFGVAPYVSYGTAFAPLVGTTFSGEPFKSTTGEQVEAGVKWQVPDANALVTAAVFDITQQNVLRADPNNIGFQVQTGEINSRGFELEAVASLGSGWKLAGGYALLDLEITRGDQTTRGNVPSGIPAHAASLWLGYTVPRGQVFAGIGGGAGARYTSAVWGDDANSFKTPGVTVFDAELHYEFGDATPELNGLRFQVNATNLFDEKYETCQSGYCYWGKRRSVIASLRYRW